MPSLTVLIEKGAICACLRDKKMFYTDGAEPLPNAMEIISASERENEMPRGPFWCVLTQKIVGPDDNFANVESCTPGRSCFTSD